MSVGGFVHEHIYTVGGGGTPGDGTVTSVTVDSPNDTIDVTNGNVTTAGTIEIDVTGTPATDGNVLNGTSSFRWAGFNTTLIGALGFDNGLGDANSIRYTDTTGPQFFDRTSGWNFNFDVTNFSSDTTITWQDQNGWPALFDDTGVLQRFSSGSKLGASTAEFAGVWLGNTSGVTFSNGPTGGNRVQYLDTHGPQFFDATKTATLTLELQNMTTNRAITVPDVTGNMLVGATPIAATIPGSVVKKIQIFAADGTSLGFIPVYSSIT